MDRLKLERKPSIFKISVILICKKKNRHAKLYRDKLIFDFSRKFSKISYLIQFARIQELTAPKQRKYVILPRPFHACRIWG